MKFNPRKFFRYLFLSLFLGIGVWAISLATSPKGDSVARHEAMQAFAPGRTDGGGSSAIEASRAIYVIGEEVSPVVVNMSDVASHPADVDLLRQQYEQGLADIEINEGPYSESVFQTLLDESLNQAPNRDVQNYDFGQPQLAALNGGASFKSIDYTQSQQGVPPDPDIMVGNDHVVVGVNTSFQVFDKNGNSLVGPTLYDTFWGSNCGSGTNNMVLFDPYSGYDESANRYVLGITGYDTTINGGDNGWACIAVSQTDSATGNWYLYSFDGNPGGGADYFFDYPHIGIGQDALYLGANMFGNFFTRNHIFAYDKNAMYAGQSAQSVKFNVGTSNFTIQPAKIKGFGNGGWPTNANEPHYFVDAQYGNNQNTLTVWAFSDPFGSPSFTQVGTVNVNSYSLPVSQPQAGSSGQMQGNDNRLLDVEYWGGKLYATHAIGCNPGGGTVNCVRWYEIDISSGSPSLVQQGTFSSSGVYRSFPDLGVNQCGDMLIGYSVMTSSSFPSTYVAGREAGDPAGQLKSETLMKAGEDYYTAYDSSPRRWGDYTGLALDPDGETYWYVGEYSRNQATARWSTWVGSYTWSGCGSTGPTPTPGPTATPVPPTPTPIPGSGDDIYVSSTSGGNAGGVSFADEDILVYNTNSGNWAMYFDGSDVGVTNDLNGFVILSGGSILMTFNTSTNVPGVGTVDDSDIVEFTPTSTGSNTAGSFAIFFDGSDVGLTTNGEDIDSITVSTDGKLVISTIGGHSVTGVSGADEDLLIFTASSFGSNTSGTWAQYFDGSDVGMGGNSNEDVYGSWVDDANGDIYLNTRGAFSVSGVSGDGADIFVCDPSSTGSTTACSFSLYWDGSANGYGGENMDGFTIVR